MSKLILVNQRTGARLEIEAGDHVEIVLSGSTLSGPNLSIMQRDDSGTAVIHDLGTDFPASDPVEISQPVMFDCGCSRLKVRAGRCDVYNPDGSERETAQYDDRGAYHDP